jgi:hypothetical protein
MRHTRHLVMTIATLAAMSPLMTAPAFSDEHKDKCSLDTLFGQYLVSANGRLFPPAFGVSKESVSAAAGYSIYNGDGTGTDYVTFTVNGVNANVASPTPTQYTLNADCTGTKTVLPYGPHFNIFVALGGTGLTEVATDPGFAVSTMDRRVAPPR